MYQVLARKYRPRNFNQLVGQTHVSKALTSALARNRLHHAYLFTGTRGVGKTTIARILSKCLNCETGITATPCEACNTCIAINEGRFIDLIEIDAASRTKVEDTRELLDNVPYAPTQGRYKVYLIDEVHMLSTHSFNALLKTLEEPPEHVKFLLATTDPQKLPVTVLSRCLQFTLRPLPQQEICDHLAHILGQEQIDFDDKALWQLAEAAQGSLRDALSLTDQAIAYGQGQLNGSDVQDMLGLLDKGQIIQLLQAIYQSHGQQISQILQNLANQAVDLKAVLDQLITLLHQLALVQLLPQVPLQGTQEYQQQLRQLAQHIDSADLQLYYQIALQGRQDLKLAVSLQQGFDMCILRMLAFKPLAANMQTLEQPASAELPSSIGESCSHQSQQPATTQDRLKEQVEPEILADQAIHSAFTTPVQAREAAGLIAQLTVDESNAKDKIAAESLVEEPALQESILKESVLEEPVSELSIVEQTIEITASVAVESQLVQPVLAEEQVVFDTQENIDPASDALTDAMTEPQPDKPAVIPEAVSVVQNSNAATHRAVVAGQVEPQHQHLLPQQILQHKQVKLDGQWDIEKWECWLREADISPAIRNLAQHGVMQGDIGGQGRFMIAPEHRLMATELIDGLIDAIKAQWLHSRIELIFENIDESLPLQLKAMRQQDALKQADYLLRQEPAIQALMQQFDAHLINVAMKD
ncbi:DNA polymerase III subunit gamma/tau [Alkanindiges sp. WGS2144]|uniref:DNA polymerase III subunit gamma/tau n=1 Tax=Alkanindiges sp. WGS2144 TaxID=3366808 RepID=UPI003750846D